MKINSIIESDVKGLQVSKIFNSDTTETLLVTLEKEQLFPTHTSPKDTFLVVLEGNINFYIENKMVILAKHESYAFPKEVKHYVTANVDAKFLIIR